MICYRSCFMIIWSNMRVLECMWCVVLVIDRTGRCDWSLTRWNPTLLWINRSRHDSRWSRWPPHLVFQAKVQLERHSLANVGLRKLYRGSTLIYVLFEHYWVCEYSKLPFYCYDVIYMKILMVLHSTLQDALVLDSYINYG